ncbi:MAG: cupin domain-containing protein [Methanofollis sp.]|uniref:cupin domain-containing protein n=1 Tax=Methanofollis sp. TaxID=2052835 RepID=UPI00261EC4A6|nr:cupin domain-containing protein [Methanofollis sp.]MDD4254006.1 cupin domain-containing protein [Methanofollis sp.]
MKKQNIAEVFENGAMLFPTHELEAKDAPWYQHPEWKGVFLKDLVLGNDTGDAFSYHLVRVQGGCEVGDHVHSDQWEWNAILRGSGVFVFDEKEIPFQPGYTFATPPGVRHMVSAGSEELMLLAVFIPRG